MHGATVIGMRVTDLMTRDVVTCEPTDSVERLMGVMTDRRIRHLPVLGEEGVVGVVTTGDLLAHELKEKDAAIQQLESFVFYVRS